MQQPKAKCETAECRRNTTTPQRVGGFLHLGVLAQVAVRLQVRLPLHLNGDRVEVEGGVTGLCHFSQDRLSVHRLICGGEESKETSISSHESPCFLTA